MEVNMEINITNNPILFGFSRGVEDLKDALRESCRSAKEKDFCKVDEDCPALKARASFIVAFPKTVLYRASTIIGELAVVILKCVAHLYTKQVISLEEVKEHAYPFIGVFIGNLVSSGFCLLGVFVPQYTHAHAVNTIFCLMSRVADYEQKNNEDVDDVEFDEVKTTVSEYMIKEAWEHSSIALYNQGEAGVKGERNEVLAKTYFGGM
jgi:hypothetical protein